MRDGLSFWSRHSSTVLGKAGRAGRRTAFLSFRRQPGLFDTPSIARPDANRRDAKTLSMVAAPTSGFQERCRRNWPAGHTDCADDPVVSQKARPESCYRCDGSLGCLWRTSRGTRAWANQCRVDGFGDADVQSAAIFGPSTLGRCGRKTEAPRAVEGDEPRAIIRDGSRPAGFWLGGGCDCSD